MKKLLFGSLCALIAALIFLPIVEAGWGGQNPNGPRREAPSARTKNKSINKGKTPAKNKLSNSSTSPQGASAEPVSVSAMSFGESAPVSQIAAEAIQTDLENEEEEAAENRNVRFVTEAAQMRSQKMSAAERSAMD